MIYAGNGPASPAGTAAWRPPRGCWLREIIYRHVSAQRSFLYNPAPLYARACLGQAFIMTNDTGKSAKCDRFHHKRKISGKFKLIVKMYIRENSEIHHVRRALWEGQ